MFKKLLYFFVPFLKPNVHLLLEQLIKVAESLYASGYGKRKKEFVLDYIYDYLNRNRNVKESMIKEFNGYLDRGLNELIEKIVAETT